MKRLLWILLAVAVLAGGLYAWGRAPGRYALEQEALRFQEQRARRYEMLQFEVGQEEARLARGSATAADVARLRARRDAILAEIGAARIRGWEVRLIPEGAPPPAPEDYLVLDDVDAPATAPGPVRRPCAVWVAPRGAVARALHALGLTP